MEKITFYLRVNFNFTLIARADLYVVKPRHSIKIQIRVHPRELGDDDDEDFFRCSRLIDVQAFIFVKIPVVEIYVRSTDNLKITYRLNFWTFFIFGSFSPW